VIDTTAYEWFSELLDIIGSRPVRGRPRQCPAHDDPSPSLAVNAGSDGRVLVKCYAGCSLGDILTALHCTPSRLNRPAPISPAKYIIAVKLNISFPAMTLRQGHPSSRGSRLEAIHEYGGGQWLLERWRSPGGQKDLLWETVRNGQRIPGLLGVPLHRLPLYRESEVRQGVALGDPVLVVESESSVDALKGWFATTWAGGASAVNVRRLRDVLGGYDRIVVIPDNDVAGLRVRDTLTAVGLAPHVVLPDPDEDARDLYRRLGARKFTDVVNGALAANNKIWSTAA
jgi:hypothetical protein